MQTAKVIEKLSPSITKMIRMDHSHVMMLSHKYTADASPGQKAAIIKSVCLALEIHAQLEEEVFYPALRLVDVGDPVLDKSKPEHDDMRRLIAQLRAAQPGTAADAAFAELMRAVLHHVADEETVLLPKAERLLADRLCELGAQMTKRRLQLAGPHLGEMAANSVRAMPTTAMAIGAVLALGAYLLGRRGSGSRRFASR